MFKIRVHVLQDGFIFKIRIHFLQDGFMSRIRVKMHWSLFSLEIELTFGEDNRCYLRPAGKLRKVMVTLDKFVWLEFQNVKKAYLFRLNFILIVKKVEIPFIKYYFILNLENIVMIDHFPECYSMSSILWGQNDTQGCIDTC